MKLLLLILLILSLQTNVYSYDGFCLRRIRGIIQFELNIDLINSIISWFNLIPITQQVAYEAVLDPSSIDEKTLAQGVVLMVAEELPQYEDIDIEEFLGVELTEEQYTGLNETVELFMESKEELVREIKEIFLTGKLPFTILEPTLEEIEQILRNDEFALIAKVGQIQEKEPKTRSLATENLAQAIVLKIAKEYSEKYKVSSFDIVDWLREYAGIELTWDDVETIDVGYEMFKENYLFTILEISRRLDGKEYQLRESDLEHILNELFFMAESGLRNEKIDFYLLNKLIEYGNKYGKRMSEGIVWMFTRYPSLWKEITYVLGNVNSQEVRDGLIDELNNVRDDKIKEMMAIALSQKEDEESIEALREVLGEKRYKIYEIFGIWVIDIEVEEEFKFKEDELKLIENALSKLPQEHLKEINSIIRVKSQEYRVEVYPPKWEFPDDIIRQYPPPAGSYERLNRVIRINETDDKEELKRTIYHEVGHGGHFQLVDEKLWNEFEKLHERSVARLPVPLWQATLDDFKDFAYPYGVTNSYEDFATIYEMLFFNEDELLRRVDKSELLKEKIKIVKFTLPGVD